MYSRKTKKDFASLDFVFANAAQLYLRCSVLLTLLSIAYAAQQNAAILSIARDCSVTLSNAQLDLSFPPEDPLLRPRFAKRIAVKKSAKSYNF